MSGLFIAVKKTDQQKAVNKIAPINGRCLFILIDFLFDTFIHFAF